MRQVVAGVLWNNDKILVCQRRKWDVFGLLWEFPGGKLEPGETPEEALRREWKEELGVPATIGPEIYRTRHTYKETKEPLEIRFFAVEADGDAVKSLTFEQILWRRPEDLGDLQFLPADLEFIRRLATGDFRPAQNS